MMQRGILISAFLTMGLLPAVRVQAGGLEYTAAGARALGRGGAVTARAEDPMVLSYNPAGLAELRGNQMLLDLNLAKFDACVDPFGYYGWGAYNGGNPSQLPDPATGQNEQIPLSNTPNEAALRYLHDPLDTVCFDQNYVPIPQLAFTARLSERLGVGFGLMFPSVQPQGRWGGKHGVIRGASGELRPAPTRYMQLSANNLGIFPTIGAGFRMTDAIRIGAAFEWGMFAIENRTMAAVSGGTSPSGDIEARVNGVDFFVPAVTASVHLVPVDAVDVVFAVRYQDAIRANGTLRATTGIFDPRLVPHTTALDIAEIHQNMPWKLRAGVRYASRLRPRAGGTGRDEGGRWNSEPIHDPLEDERWDIELDVEYQINSLNQRQMISYPDTMNFPQAVEFKNQAGDITTSEFPNPAYPYTVIEKRWQDQVSLRLGGTYNVLPGTLGVSLGAHYETRGINPDYMQVDFWPVSRVGLHTGIILRLSRVLDLSFSYARIFQETLVVAPAEHRNASEISGDYTIPGTAHNIDQRIGAPPARGSGGAPVPVVPAENVPANPDGHGKHEQNLTRLSANQPPYLTNAGRYRSGFHIVSVGANFHF